MREGEVFASVSGVPPGRRCLLPTWLLLASRSSCGVVWLDSLVGLSQGEGSAMWGAAGGKPHL